MKKSLVVSLALLVSTALPALAAPPAPAPAPQGAPAPRIVVVDQGAILQMSKVGQDIGRQVQAYSNQAKKDLDAQARALQAKGQALQQQVAILSPEVKAQKVKEFESQQAGLQAAAQKKESLIQGGLLQARQAIAQQLSPILTQLLQQRGANMIIAKSAVLMANDGRFDVTQQAIDMLNQKMSTYKVQLVAPPAGFQQGQ